MPDTTDSRYDSAIGRRIQAVRAQRGFTQHGLAQRAHISYSTITKVESGRMAASPTVTAACARALRVPVTDLTGQPYFDALKQDQLEELVQPLRHAVANPMLPEADRDLRPLAEIREDIATLETDRLRGEYMNIGVRAPALIDDLLTLIEQTPAGRRREQTYDALAMTYRLARCFSHKLGFLDLALLALDRMEQAAERGGDPFLPVVVCHYRSDYFLHHGAYSVGLRNVASMERLLEEPVRRGEPRAMSAQGTMHLKAAVFHSRERKSSSAADVEARLGEARDMARRTAEHQDPYGLIFDTYNVEIHATSTRLDLGDPGGAAEHGGTLSLPDGWAMNRAGHHHMDMGRALEKAGHREDALRALEEARRTAPTQTRYHPTTRETVLALLRGRGTPSTQLRAYARWVGV